MELQEANKKTEFREREIKRLRDAKAVHLKHPGERKESEQKSMVLLEKHKIEFLQMKEKIREAYPTDSGVREDIRSEGIRALQPKNLEV